MAKIIDVDASREGEVSRYDVEGSLKEVKEQIEEWIKQYGEEARLDFNIEDHGYDGGTYVDISLIYKREETPEEEVKRLAKQKEEKDWRDDRDEKEFKRLKEKFEKEK